jgi:hypothetical protein
LERLSTAQGDLSSAHLWMDSFRTPSRVRSFSPIGYVRHHIYCGRDLWHNTFSFLDKIRVLQLPELWDCPQRVAILRKEVSGMRGGYQSKTLKNSSSGGWHTVKFVITFLASAFDVRAAHPLRHAKGLLRRRCRVGISLLLRKVR